MTVPRVMEALRDVRDPEIGLSIVKLGLVYDVRIDARTVRVVMTLTAPGCPLHGVMTTWVREAIEQIDGVDRVDIDLTFDPPWTPDMIRSDTDDAR